MKKALIISFLVTLAIFLWVLFGESYQVRFNYSPLNYLVFAVLCVAIPGLMLAYFMTFKSDLIKLPGVTLGLLLLLGPGLGFAGLASFKGFTHILNGNSGERQVINVVSNNSDTFRLYRTNCGATCNFGLLLQKEIDTPLGFRFVKEMWSMDPAYDAELITNAHGVQVVHEGVVVAEVN